MSMLGSILSGIFGQSAAAGSSSAPGSRPGVAKAEIAVAPILDKLAEQADDDDLDWRKSIVDLMKVLNLDSSPKARKQLAKELNYSGNPKNSTALNIWLHKQVMIKLAENGGKVPEELKH